MAFSLRPGSPGLLLAMLSLSLAALGPALAIRCYTCNSRNGACNDPVDGSSGLDLADDCTVCYKVKTVEVQFATSSRDASTNVFTSRMCVADEGTKDWYLDGGSGSEVVGTYCSNDLCNSADVITTSLRTCIALVILGASAVLRLSH